ncbi:MAG: hypothetical protein QM619_07355 [Micropruina sp.]|uniref:hypothetical protein n=1 Tax=Micropruina sp. TaxID=2737536 RepID=UPI0039E2E9EF
MTHDLLIVSERALTASDLAAGVSAVHQVRPWQVTNDGDQLAVLHCDQPVLRVLVSTPLGDPTPSTHSSYGRQASRFSMWRTELAVDDEQMPLGLDVARAVAWETGGTLLEMPH